MKKQIEMAKKNKINFIIPDFLNMEGSIYLLDTFRSNKEIFKDEINIIGLIGQFSGCIWNKNDKKSDKYILSVENIFNIRNNYKKYDMSLVISFDKEDIEYKDLEDTYANKIMEIFNDKKNYVLCKSDKLKKYIKEKYKNIKIMDYYENKNDYMIVNPTLNRDSSIINSSFKDKMVIMPDLGYIPNKKWLFNHVKNKSKLNKINYKKDRYFSKEKSKSFLELKKQNNYLKYEDLIEYSKIGINTFMLSGLGVYNYAMYENIVDYLFKEEYKKDQLVMFSKCISNYIQQEMLEIFNYRL